MNGEPAEEVAAVPIEWRAYATIGEQTSAEGIGARALSMGNTVGVSARRGSWIGTVELRAAADATYPCVPRVWCGDWGDLSLGAGLGGTAWALTLSVGWLPHSGVAGAHAWWTPLGAPRGPVYAGLEAGFLLPLYQTPDRLAWSAYVGLRGELRVSP